jgi:hypothetical protein
MFVTFLPFFIIYYWTSIPGLNAAILIFSERSLSFIYFVSGLFMQILQFLKTFRAQVPVSGPERYFSILTNFPLMFPAFCIYQTELNVRRSPGGLYYLSYLDRDMLLGRSVGGGGVFIFTRAQPLI